MDVNAIAQAAQTQQQPVSPQDSGNGTAADMFAYLLKHQFGSNVGKPSLANSQAAIDMVGTAQNAAPAAVLNTPAAAPVQQNAAQHQNQTANTGNTGNQPATGPMVNAANNNTNGNTGGRGQSNNGPSQAQQGPAAANTSNGPAQGTGPAAAAQAKTNTGEDQATEETAAAMAAVVYIAPQQTAPIATVDPVAGPTVANPTASGAQQQSTGPVAGPAAAQAAQQIVAAAQDDSAPDATHSWTANFLNSNGPATSQIAQQASSLAKITGPSGANISVQTTTGSTVTPTSTGTLVPDAVMAIPSFFAQGDHDASTGGGTDDQQSGQQTNDNAPAATIDPMSQTLASDMQALSAISALLQGAAQTAIGSQQGGAASIAATSGASAATEAALPQPTAPTSPNSAAPSSFVSQLQETEEPEEPQAPKQTQLPSAIDQIKMQIEKGVAAGSSTIKVQLNPDNMGRVDVKLEVQGGTVKATISADHPETLALLKNDQAGMLQALQDAGLNADSNSLSFFLRGDQQRQFAQSGRQGRGQSGGASDDPAIAGVAAASGASAASGAANSALDISV